jgi:hypothetical protein
MLSRRRFPSGVICAEPRVCGRGGLSGGSQFDTYLCGLADAGMGAGSVQVRVAGGDDGSAGGGEGPLSLLGLFVAGSVGWAEGAGVVFDFPSVAGGGDDADGLEPVVVGGEVGGGWAELGDPGAESVSSLCGEGGGPGFDGVFALVEAFGPGRGRPPGPRGR